MLSCDTTGTWDCCFPAAPRGSCVVRGEHAGATGFALQAAFWQLVEAGPCSMAAGFLPWSVRVPVACCCSLRTLSVAVASFLMCGRVGRQFVGSCCYRCACSKTHTELEAVNLSPGLPVGINYSLRAVARMPNVFLWELRLASDATRGVSPRPLQLRLVQVGSPPAKSCPCGDVGGFSLQLPTCRRSLGEAVPAPPGFLLLQSRKIPSLVFWAI